MLSGHIVPRMGWICPKLGEKLPFALGSRRGRAYVPLTVRVGSCMMKLTLKAVLLASTFGALSSAAFAADLMAEPPAAPAMAPSTTQFYGGFNIGYGMGLADHRPVTPPGGFPNGFDLNLAGFVVGGQVGAMFHLDNNMIIGVQGDLDWSNITGSGTFGGFGSRSQTINWIGTGEGRLGFDTGGGIIPYLAGGVAVAQSSRTSTPGTTASNYQAGLSVGAGVMLPVADNMNVDLEYRYQAFQPVTYNTGGTPPSVALSVSTIRAGLNFNF